MATKYFFYPFGVAGDRTAIPNTSGDGSVNYDNGYGPDYSLNIASDPAALPLERKKFNQLMYDVTLNLQQIQQFSVPNFITTSDNGGTAFSYGQGVRVYYSGVIYESLKAANTDLPTVTASWKTINSAGSQVIWGGTAGGSANALTFTAAVSPSAYVAGMILNGTINTTSTSGTVTINFNGLGNLTVKKSIGGALVALGVGDLQSATDAMFLIDATASQAVLLNPRAYSLGTTVAAASTINLDTTTGDYINLSASGSPSISTITLSPGRQVTVVIAGICTFVNSGSIILPNSANIVATVGDVYTFRGDSAGVVRLVDYCLASGQSIVNTSITAATSSTIRTGTNNTQFATALAINGAFGLSSYFQSAQQTITSAGTLTIAHGLGRTPILIVAWLVNQNTEAGYSPGDIVFIPASIIDSSANNRGLSIVPDATNLNVKYASATNVFVLVNKSTGSTAGAVTNANWKLVMGVWG